MTEPRRGSARGTVWRVSAAHLWSDLRDLLLPAFCAGCGDLGGWWCAACDGAAPSAPGRAQVAGVPVVSGALYAHLGPAVLAYKQRGVAALRRPLAERLLVAVSACRPDGAVLVPIPTTRRSRVRRGGDPLAALAADVALRTGLPVADALRWRGGHRAQKRLSGEQRWRNMQSALSARPTAIPWGAPVVIVDDVLTTGATVAAAAAALRSAGIVVAAGAVVCAAQSRGAFGG